MEQCKRNLKSGLQANAGLDIDFDLDEYNHRVDPLY